MQIEITQHRIDSEKCEWLLVLVQDEGKVIGSCAVLNWHGCIPYIANLAVLPPHRGRGAGTLIINATIDYTRNAGKQGLNLWVHHENPAKRLYERLGFVVCNDRQEWEARHDVPLYRTTSRGAH